MAKGSIRREGASWSVVVDVGRDPTTGKRKQMRRRGFRIKGDAQRWLTDQLGRLDRGEYVKPSRATYGESLAKGSRVVVVGRLQQRTWTAEDGSARSVVGAPGAPGGSGLIPVSSVDAHCRSVAPW